MLERLSSQHQMPPAFSELVAKMLQKGITAGEAKSAIEAICTSDVQA